MRCSSLWGQGSNGKTTFVGTLMRLLASYAAQMAAETLLLKKGDSSTALNDLATLHGARFRRGLRV
jgi:putative DNA primase/helicase